MPLTRENIAGTPAEQLAIAKQTANILPLCLLDNRLIITHGNGPVVGMILMRQALLRDRIPPMTLEICVAHSQGDIAYLLTRAIETSRAIENGRRGRSGLPKSNQVCRSFLYQRSGAGHCLRSLLAHAGGRRA
jgi:carbamate kinase